MSVAALRVVVCEDSRVYAEALVRMLEYDGDIAVDAVYPTAEEALAALPRVDPDLVTMDVELPGLSGLEAVGAIMSSRPRPILVLSGHLGRGSYKAAAALHAGALDAFAKDDLDLHDPAGAMGAAFRHRVRVLSQAPVIRHPRPKFTTQLDMTGLPRLASAVGMCASVGGPQLLMTLLQALPADYPIPLLIVQHMLPGYTDGLVSWLDHTVEIPVGMAADQMQASPGAWFAPEGAHLMLSSSGRLELDRQTAATPHRPSGDVLLRSIAAAAGSTGVAIVLSGMGSDGAEGAAAVRGVGGVAIAQDERSSAVFGMPKAAIDRGVELVLSPAEIGTYLLGLRRVPLPGERR
jgi:two-component system, chemotaxis family, protein-glutamate methylesterase/glutaminase